ncbi:hypothetical protein AB0M86_37820, partial [Streptomyces sp. NPDC051639]|uniref:hypothetical protein n=1 Tax=Streptomyces sp. NPDC051639 TaxID=3155671 RepID=UPI00342554FC
MYDTLTQLQLDGVTCVTCGQIGDVPMVSVGPAPYGLVDLHAHPTCIDAKTRRTEGVVLVVGNSVTPVALEDLTAFAFDVADRLGLPARIAVGMDYAVTDYAGVVLCDSYLDSVPSAVLGTEALEADM